MTLDGLAWVPDACTLPTVERPVRLAEFDELFALSLCGQQRLSPTVLRWRLHPVSETTARDLAAREGSCCSFLSFAFAGDGDSLHVDVEVSAAHVPVLDALEERAAVGMAG